MVDINLFNYLNNALNRQRLPNTQNNLNSRQMPSNPAPAQSSSTSQAKIPTSQPTQTQNLQMNTLKSIDRAIYAKDVMGIPKNLNEFIYMLQRGMTQAQFNKMFSSQLLSQKNSLSQLQAQILAQLQGLETENIQVLVNKQLSTQLQSSLKNLDILSNGMINLNQISQLLQANGKEALTKIIMAMTEASKSGITDLSQMRDMAKLINASIAIAAENDSAKTLKLLLMLYLPWFPLKEGVDFDLEVSQSDKENGESDSILTVTITTINYGTVVATLILETSNSVQVVIECGPEFPKEEFELRMSNDKKHYSMDTVTSFNIKQGMKPQSERAKASINMSQTTEINPYLLLSAHSVIKHVIDIDNNASIGINSHTDSV